MNTLKKRVWKPGEKAAWLADKIVTGSPEYCNEAAGLLRNYSDLEKENEAMRRYLSGEKPFYSTGICESLTCGYGKLDEYGYFEFPLKESILKYLTEVQMHNKELDLKLATAVDNYVKSRPQLDTIHNRRIYEAGYRDGAESIGSLQARIDALMLEYCPEEMSEEQIKEWGGNQKVASKETEKLVNEACSRT